MIATKGRKVVSRAGESPTGAFGSSAADDEIIIKHRLLTRATTTRGDPPFKKLQKKFASFFSEIETDENPETETASKLGRAFLQELSTFEIPLTKSKAAVEANQREKVHFEDLNEEIEARIRRSRVEIEKLKGSLEESKAERRHKEECESVRRLIAGQPQRGRTERAVAELEAEIAELEREEEAAEKMIELRRKQFALLMHVVDELQGTLDLSGVVAPSSDPMLLD